MDIRTIGYELTRTLRYKFHLQSIPVSLSERMQPQSVCTIMNFSLQCADNLYSIVHITTDRSVYLYVCCYLLICRHISYFPRFPF